ncbi:hypothetical protein [Deinococcus multiflagellatus]|uniref:Uncharacterized protein n=1 Tax=Deinococcus multiflagellatus TaxID=1656887 RepID=A0ABW1ZS00_9DEIO|nr:hypothetical protein [Deinococcus multiflagellatus]MBZ9716146.1 hypothetical protein [Deinococcus multiflagellatus]
MALTVQPTPRPPPWTAITLEIRVGRTSTPSQLQREIAMYGRQNGVNFIAWAVEVDLPLQPEAEPASASGRFWPHELSGVLARIQVMAGLTVPLDTK